RPLALRPVITNVKMGELATARPVRPDGVVVHTEDGQDLRRELRLHAAAPAVDLEWQLRQRMSNRNRLGLRGLAEEHRRGGQASGEKRRTRDHAITPAARGCERSGVRRL